MYTSQNPQQEQLPMLSMPVPQYCETLKVFYFLSFQFFLQYEKLRVIFLQNKIKIKTNKTQKLDISYAMALKKIFYILFRHHPT